MQKISFKRKIFYLLYNLIGMHLPRTYMPYSFGSKYIRYFLVKNFANKCGKNIKIEPNVHLSPFIEIGDNVEINEGSRIRANVKIGDNVLIAQNVNLISEDHQYQNKNILIKNQGDRICNIVIGNDVWIGANTIILPCIKISKGCVIGAASIVTKSFSEYSVIAGNPAKLIKKRY